MGVKNTLKYPRISNYVPDEIPLEDELMYNVEIDADHFESLTFINYMKVQDSLAAIGGFISILKLIIMLFINFINRYKFSFMIFKEAYFGTEKVDLDMNHEIQDQIKLEKIERRKARINLLAIKKQKKKNKKKVEESSLSEKNKNELDEKECISNICVYKKENKNPKNILMNSSSRDLKNLELSELNGEPNFKNDNNCNSIIIDNTNSVKNFNIFEYQNKKEKYMVGKNLPINIVLEEVIQNNNKNQIIEREIKENEKNRESERIRFNLSLLSLIKSRIFCFSNKKVKKIRNDSFNLIFNKIENALEIRNFFKMKEDFIYFKELIFGDEHTKIFKHNYTSDEIFYGNIPNNEYVNYNHLKENMKKN